MSVVRRERSVRILGLLMLCTCRAGDADADPDAEVPEACDALLACVAEAAPLALSEVAGELGEGGSCWETVADADLCRSACAQALHGYGVAGGFDACPDYRWFVGAWEGELKLAEKSGCRGFAVPDSIPVVVRAEPTTPAGDFDFEADGVPDGVCGMQLDGACSGSGAVDGPSPYRIAAVFREAPDGAVRLRVTVERDGEEATCVAVHQGVLAPADGVEDTSPADTGG